jgi:hypothetical protein
VRQPVINGERWIRDRLCFLRERLACDISDAERDAIQAELAVLSQEPGITLGGSRSLRWSRLFRPR